MDRRHLWLGHAWALAAAVAASAAGWLMAPRFDPVNIAMVYVLGVAAVALRHRRAHAVSAAVFAILAFDVLFVPPRGAVTVDDAQYLFTFGAMLAIALLVSGLTDRVRQQARREAELAIAAESEHVRSTLLASISHDLRTPLAVLTGASSSLAERGEAMSAAERGALAAALHERAQEMASQVDKVLDMTRLDGGGVALHRDWVAIDEVVASVVDAWREPLSRHRLVVEVEPGLPLVMADAPLLAKALGNLLENAARHTPAQTVVRLRARHSGGELLLSVEDYGGGVPEAELERVFAAFAHARPEAAGRGLGLGLAICRAIVALHGGRTWAERLDGGGSAFRIALPVPQAPSVPRESEVAAA